MGGFVAAILVFFVHVPVGCVEERSLYSADGQDAWAMQYHPTPGVFLEIGARDGDFYSNTRALEEHGWTGTCVEPFPANFEKYKRTCDLKRVAVVDKIDGEKFFSNCEDGSGQTGWSGFSVENKNDEGVKGCSQVLVPQLTVADLQIELHPIIDFLSLDVEGFELPIMQVWDFDKTCVRLWAIEAEVEEPRRAMKQILTNKGCFQDVEKHDCPGYVGCDLYMHCDCSVQEVLQRFLDKESNSVSVIQCLLEKESSRTKNGLIAAVAAVISSLLTSLIWCLCNYAQKPHSLSGSRTIGTRHGAHPGAVGVATEDDPCM